MEIRLMEAAVIYI